MDFETTTITKIMIALTVLLAGFTGVVEITAAQETPTETTTNTSTTTVTATPTAAPTSTATPVTDNSTATLVIGPLAKVTEWEYRDGEFTLSIETKAPTLLTISEAPDTSRESGNGRLSRQRLARGENVVRFSTERTGSTIVLTTPGSIRNGEYAYISPDGGSGSFLSGPPRPADVRDGAIGASLGTALAALIVIVRRRFGLHRGMVRQA
jgi:hypothetical protein